ncbi:hypothetical protein Q4603_09875 [Zobellia galactanivorans]|uniref:hypothetical protein n=1 Tax=Zobellia TaxID=112040 RepID=UPI000B5364D0|nr:MULTISPECIES: hypothetical protein [Zobellia]MDO6808921.1 hypothetical protein [Zobellia galactanivorans]OWW25895.1 hypothetical protein B4Q04_09905 [Zobellia sp. OII3]
MKNILIITILFTVHTTYAQNNFYESTCDCINLIKDKSNESELAYKTKDCLKQSTTNHPEKVKKIFQDYVNDHPKTSIEFTENNVSVILTEKLSEKCPEFARIDSFFRTRRNNSENIIVTVADEICAQARNEPELSGQVVNRIRKKSFEKYLVSIYAQYNLNDSLDFKRFEDDLRSELEKNCDVPNK